MESLHIKKQKLENYIRDLGSVVIAFSAGVDSTFLLKTAKDVLGGRAVAVTSKSCVFPERELEAAVNFCKNEKIEHIIMESDELSIEGFSKNPRNRCYLCKRDLFKRIIDIAKSRGIKYVAEGSNLDDTGDFRPGLAAAAELGIKSPLMEAGLTKDDIRKLSHEMGLPTWDKPSYACLASRFVYGEEITAEKLAMVDKAEKYLMELGLRQVRVRVHGNIARIETDCADLSRVAEKSAAAEIDEYLKKLGFMYVTLDLGGYKTGNMNKTAQI